MPESSNLVAVGAPALPLLDLRQLEAGPTERAHYLQDLRDAARDCGFFYLTGHGVSEALASHVWAESCRFFAMPEAEKLAVGMIHSPYFRGYNRAGQELIRGRPDWREQFDVQAERIPIPQGPDTPPWARLQGPNLWPAGQPALREVLLAWQDELTRIATRVVSALVEALGQPADALAPIYEGMPNQTLKIIRYPGQAETDQGVGAHKDSGLLTLLLQDEVGGLQVQRGDQWLPATPVPGTFVVNIGELLELASNGYLRATVHRVVSPRPAPGVSPSHSFLAPGWTPRCRCWRCRQHTRRRRRAPPAIRTTHSFTASAIRRGGYGPIRT